jgi:hypothetical protein
MKSTHIAISSLIVLSIATCTTFFLLGIPEQKALSARISNYISELYQVVNGSDGDKASFLAHGFCTNGDLEQLALSAQTPDELVLVNNLGSDCVVVTGLLNS